MAKTKGAIVSAAFRKARISGITTQPTGDELAGGIETLEDMMRELISKNVSLPYAYEDEPDLSTDSNLPSEWYHAVQSRLAVLLCSDYGIEPGQTLRQQAAQAWTSMIGKLTMPRQNVQPRTMPRGSGNIDTLGVWSRYYTGDNRAPISAETVQVDVGEIKPLVVSFDNHMTGSESIQSFEVEDITDGITQTSDISSDAQSIELTITATEAGAQSLVVKVTTTLGRVQLEKRWFNVREL